MTVSIAFIACRRQDKQSKPSHICGGEVQMRREGVHRVKVPALHLCVYRTRVWHAVRPAGHRVGR